MSYGIVRLLCMFDVPFDTAKEQREYRIFRKHLITHGFVMLQYSIYYRSLPNRSALKKYESIIKSKAPSNGNVRLMYVTENQFQEMILLTGEKSKQEELIGNKRLVII